MKLSSTIDTTAVGLSLACAAHCLLLPALLAFTPTLAATVFANENFHLWLLLAVIPTSLIALTLGCRQHRNHSVLALGAVGIALMCLAAILGHDLLGEITEKTLTLTGASLIAIGHIKNYQWCQQSNCQCDH